MFVLKIQEPKKKNTCVNFFLDLKKCHQTKF